MAKSLVQFAISGDKELQAKLKHLRASVQRRGTKKAMTAAMKPVKPAVKANAPRETGQMRKTATTKVVSYATKGVVMGIGGIRRDARSEKTGRNPSKYLHLVIGGVKGHDIVPETKKAMRFRKKRARSAVFAMKVKHPGFQGDNFMQRAFDSAKGPAQAAFSHTLGSFVEAEAK